MDFAIDSDVHDLLPTLCVGVVEARGVDNSTPHPEVDEILDDAIEGAKELLAGRKASDDPRVLPYREAFHKLGMSPSRYPSSNIALLKRIAKGKGVFRVNPIVDLGNAVSIKYGLPLGVHAMGPGETLRLRLSRPGDVFVELGSSKPDETLEPGELVYAVGNLVQTRRWTWRQSENGKVVAETRDLLIPIDGFTDQNEDEVRAACKELVMMLQGIFGCEASFRMVS